MGTLWGREPVMFLAVLQAALALALGLGVHLTTEQIALILAFAAAVLGFITRSQVTPTSGATALPTVDLTKVGKP